MSQASQVSHAGLRAQIQALYELLCSPRFAIILVIALAVASILGLIIIDQIPFRGEMARVRYADRPGDPVVWLLIHVIPASPFRSLLFRTLLALLSLSLLACTIKRWRLHWRQALTIAPPRESAWDSPGALSWVTAQANAEGPIAKLLRRRGFTLRAAPSADGVAIVAKRCGVTRLGPVLTHLGFLLLVIGGLWMASAGQSRLLWLRPGDWIAIPETPARLLLEDFRIETTATGQVADYISSVALYQDTSLVRRAEIEVNKPLRHRGYSFYQSSYREDPLQVRSIDLVMDVAQLEESRGAHGAAPAGAADGRPQHSDAVRTLFTEPVTVRLPWGARVPLDPTPYAVEIDTFFADFRIDARGPGLASPEPRNPAVRLRFFAADTLCGASWYFAFHPGMSVGSAPELPLRFASYTPWMTTGIDMSTHPGSGSVWAGIVVMTLGTLLSFVLRYERVGLRLRRHPGGWEITLLHHGASTQAPEYAREAWETRVTPLAGELLRRLEPAANHMVRWPQKGSAAGPERS